MRQARTLVVAIALATVALAGCGDQEASQSTTSPANRLEAAIDKTLAVKSMVITSTGAEPVTEYIAPDRARTRFDGGLEVRIIANVTYVPAMEAPGSGWWSRTATPGRPIEPLVGLHLLRNPDEVTESGDELAVTLRADQGTASVELQDGYVVRIEHTSQGGSEPITILWRFSEFNEPVDPIEAPPADEVTEQPTDDPPKETALPLPNGSTESTLQFRGVLNDSASGCSNSSVNPAPESPARLTSSEGACYELDAADLELTSVKEFKAYEGEKGMVSVDITLMDDDAKRFDAMARQHLGGRLAMVAFGEVLIAPDVMTDEFGGKLSISSITPEMASSLRAALT